MLDSDASNLTITLRLEQGQSIDKHVDSNSNSILSSSSCATIRRQMAGALAFLHSSSVIHDDVKPDNIMYSDEDQHTVLIDFGAALIQMPEDYFNPSGTPSYAPPEFLYRQKSAKGDIWGLGITMLFALGYITLPDGGWILPVALEGGTKARQEMLAWLAEVERLRIEMVARDALTASMLIADPTRRISSDELFQQLGMLG